MDNNAKSAFMVTRLVLPRMLEQGRGIIINTSTTGVRAATHLESAYCASKAAMNQMARSIAVEFRDRGIRCNNICPSFVRTRHGEAEIDQLRAYGVFASEQDVAAMQGRICEPEEIASVAVFLANDESSFINGAEIFVDSTLEAGALWRSYEEPGPYCLLPCSREYCTIKPWDQTPRFWM